MNFSKTHKPSRTATLNEYESQHSYIGAALGRVTERIKCAKFEIDGVEYKVSANDNNIHQIFVQKMFTASINGDTVVMKYVSPDGEEGFPGEVTTEFTFRLTEENELILGYTATTTKPTPVNLSNHVYFNLAGHGAGNVGDHILTVNSCRHIPLDKEYIPLGDGTISDVKGTPFDLTTPTQLRERMKDVLVSNYVFEGHGKKKHVAKLELPSTGRTVDCFTTEPCMETYFSCAMGTMKGKNGATYGAYENGGLCLIPMQYTSAVNMTVVIIIIMATGTLPSIKKTNFVASDKEKPKSPQPRLTSRASPSKIADDRLVNSSLSNQTTSKFGKKSKKVKNK
uniref:Galactose mutarotase n=1 Tax=Magallana gigas TaxID=29159 RepID=K1RLZ7_MAGGI